MFLSKTSTEIQKELPLKEKLTFIKKKNDSNSWGKCTIQNKIEKVAFSQREVTFHLKEIKLLLKAKVACILRIINLPFKRKFTSKVNFANN